MITLPIDPSDIAELTDLNHTIQEDFDGTPETIFARERSLREKVVPILAGFLADLVEAGLLSVSVEHPRTLKKRYRSVQYDVMAVEENGNLMLSCYKSSGEFPALTPDGHPNIGRDGTFHEYCRESHRLAKGPKKPFKVWIAENEQLMKKRFDEYHASMPSKPRSKLVPVLTT